jgi:hypothetical protein
MTTNQIRLQIAEKSAGSLNFPPDPVRDAIVQEGITINGLLLELTEDKKKGWRNEPTASYYPAHVIGGPERLLYLHMAWGILKRRSNANSFWKY